MITRMLAALAVLLACGPASAAERSLDPMIAADETAIFAYSGTFVAERPLHQLRALELTEASGRPLLVAGAPPAIIIDQRRGQVRVPFATDMPPMVAAHRRNLGCTLLPLGAASDAVARLPDLSCDCAEVAARHKPWWAGSPRRAAARVATRLTPFLDRAFARDGYGREARSIGIIVIQDDQLLAERYREGFGPRVPYRTWSIAKSIAGALVGVAA